MVKLCSWSLLVAALLAVLEGSWHALSCSDASALEDLEHKYDVISAAVLWSNRLVWGSSTAGATMHQAIGSPVASPARLDAVVTDEAVRLIAAGCGGAVAQRPGGGGATLLPALPALRVFDAGSGWGGTSFALARGLAQLSPSPPPSSSSSPSSSSPSSPMPPPRFVVSVDGVTLSALQRDTAQALAAEQGLGDRVRFHKRSFDDIAEVADAAVAAAAVASGDGSSGGGAGGFDLAVAVESLVHSRDVRRTLRAITASLRPTSAGCHASHLIITDDVLVAPPASSPPTAEGGASGDYSEGGDDTALLGTYKKHWAGWSGSSFPLTEPQWRDALLAVEGGAAAAEPQPPGAAAAAAAVAGAVANSSDGTDGARSIRFVDLGAVHGMRLHGAARLRVVAAILRAAHGAVGALRHLGFHLAFLESYLGTYRGAIARERLLVGGRLRYALITMTKTHMKRET